MPIDESMPSIPGETDDATLSRLADFRPYLGASLQDLTGEIYGDDMEVWEEWWEENEKSFDPAAVAADPNRTLESVDHEARCSLTRPSGRWKWIDEAEKGFSRSADLLLEGKTAARLSLFSYSTWSGKPKTAEEKAAAEKQVLEDLFKGGRESTWGEEIEFAGVSAFRHSIEGFGPDGLGAVREVILLHRQRVYVLRGSLFAGAGRMEAKALDEFMGSFRFLL